jgi:hypothetical protein
MLAPSSSQPGLDAGEPEQAIAFGMLQDYDQALVWIERAEAAAPEMLRLILTRSALLALAGQEADARTTMQRYLASDNAPLRTITQWKDQGQGVTFGPRFLMWLQKFEEGLRKAGLPE